MHRRIDHSRSDGVEADASLAYSIARLRVIASSPPLVIIGNEAFTPAIGCSTIALVMQVTLPPVFCASICFTASWVM
jgi:hypothetical protein